jgi:hypothetical protein
VGIKGGYNTPAYNIFIYHFEHYVYYLMLHENLHKKERFGWKGRVRMEGKGSDGREGFGWKGKVRMEGKGSDGRERFG